MAVHTMRRLSVVMHFLGRSTVYGHMTLKSGTKLYVK